MTEPLLEVEGLDVTYQTKTGDLRAVTDASLSIDPNEYFGLVGESGCGKSTLAQAVTNSLDSNGAITEGTIKYRGEEVQDLSEKEYNEKIRWKEIAVIPQSAMNSLDPLSRISELAIEVAEAHTDWSEERAVDELKQLFDVVGLPESRVHDYPHQFSGGMKQRAIIAFSLLLEPSMVIADEPTTALDVIMQDQFLKHLDELREIRDFSLLFITHDIAVVFEMCNSMAVMHGGQIAEQGTTEAVFDEPRHPYTILLQQAFPDIRYPNRELEGIEGVPPSLQEEVDYCTFADRCPWAEQECWEGAPPLETVPDNDDAHEVACIRNDEIEDLAAEYLDERDVEGAAAGETPVAKGASAAADRGDEETVLELDGLHKHFDQSTNIIDSIKSRFFGEGDEPVRAVDGVDLELKGNQIQGVIGESGCGKSTLLQTIMGKYSPTDGEILFDGDPVSEFDKSDWKEFRQRVQIILQDPFNTLNPHFTVRETLMEPLRIHDMERSEERILDILEQVRLTPAEQYIDRSESQLSGGEKQRVAIARALILEPDVILADEPVSMLDVSTQASVLDLLNDLTNEYGVSMLYISHDLSTVSYVCDRVNVMYLGRLVESAPTMELLNGAKHPYTRSLLQAIPVPDPHHEREWAELPGTPGDATDLPGGCRFKDRCPDRMDICDTKPAYVDVEDGDHQTACHLHYNHEECGEEVADTPAAAISDGGEPR
ncbi:ABC transporter ATP-binding protein [Halobellus rufus]|uniref:ABC transporter ATP-binding protein n=1 Tax=Halobellus rufus TaxID=1448860 RepID=UPI0006795B48|nr:ABC transporter ATP-binding protein [Halobellus rufus]